MIDKAIVNNMSNYDANIEDNEMMDNEKRKPRKKEMECLLSSSDKHTEIEINEDYTRENCSPKVDNGLDKMGLDNKDGMLETSTMDIPKKTSRYKSIVEKFI